MAVHARAGSEAGFPPGGEAGGRAGRAAASGAGGSRRRRQVSGRRGDGGAPRSCQGRRNPGGVRENARSRGRGGAGKGGGGGGGGGGEGRGDPQPGAAEQRREDPRCHSPLSGGSPPAPGPVLTQLRVPVAAPSQLLQVALQHVREEVAGAQLHRVPAQRLADLRHRDPQQRPGVTLAHPAPWTPPQPSLPLSPPAPPNLSTALDSSSRAPAAGKSCPPSPGDRLKAPAARSAPA